MEFKNITVNKTNILDVDCIYRQIVELTTLYNIHKHQIKDITDFPLIAYNDGKILSIVNGAITWIDSPAIPPTNGHSGKFLTNNGISPSWEFLPFFQANWLESDIYSEEFIKNKPDIPNSTSDLINDSGFITLGDVPVQVYTDDIPVVLSGGKTLGRYVNGDTIPSTGKTPQEVTILIAQEPLAPTLTLTSPTSIQFNQIAISNVLNFTRVINSLGGTVATASLEWRRNNTGAWTVLSTSPINGSFTHILTDSAFNTQPFNYRYVVTDTIGGTATVTLNIIPAAYVAPSITFSALGIVASPESQTTREVGNTTSTLQGSTTRNSPLVDIASYKFQSSVNGGAFTDLTSDISLAAGGTFFTNLLDSPTTSTTTSVTYRVIVTDSYTTTSTTYSITFKTLIFYGDVDVSATLNSTTIRSLSNKRFVDTGSPFTFNTGTTNRRFIVAWDTTRGLSQALDTNNNVDLSAVFITNTFNVNNAAGDAISYNNLVYTNALVYNPQITIRITYI